MHRDTHPLGDQLRAEDADLGKQRGEFVAADARHHVPATNEQSQRMTDDSEQRITGGVAVRVIDVLQAVNVHGEHGKREPRDGAQRPVELTPVLEARERVGGCEGRELDGRSLDCRLRAGSLDEPREVMADRGHRSQHSAVRTCRRLAEDCKHADHAAAAADRERHRSVNARRRGFRDTAALAPGDHRGACRAAPGPHDPAHERRSRTDTKRPTSRLEGRDIVSAVRR